MRKPGMRVNRGLRLTASREGPRPLRRRGHRPPHGHGELHRRRRARPRRGLRGKARGGIASYRSEFEGIGLSVGRERDDRLAAQPRQAEDPGPGQGRRTPRVVHLRMRARGNVARFQVSADGMVWRTVGRTFRGPVYESARFALTAGGVRARLGGLPQRLAQRELNAGAVAVVVPVARGQRRHGDRRARGRLDA